MIELRVTRAPRRRGAAAPGARRRRRARSQPPARRSRSAPGERAIVGTGLAVAIPEGHAGLVVPRSGLALRHGISIVNAPGRDRRRLPRRGAGDPPQHRPRATRSRSSRGCGSPSCSSCPSLAVEVVEVDELHGDGARRRRLRLVGAAMRPEPRIRVSAILRWHGRILLCRHEKRGREHWLLPGGGVRSGETLTRGAAAGARARRPG